MTQYFKIKDFRTNGIVFDGHYKTMRDCVEAAINQGKPLCYCDLSHSDLSHANLDGGCFIGADFINSNLTGANMSECDLTMAQFNHTDMDNACLALSTCYAASFVETYFNQTDVTDTLFEQCHFSNISALSVKWGRALSFKDNYFIDKHGHGHILSKPPISVCGLPHKIYFLNGVVFVNDNAITHTDLFDKGEVYYRGLYGENTTDYLFAYLYYKQINKTEFIS